MDFINKKALKENIETLSNIYDLPQEDIVDIMERQVFPKTFRQQIDKEAVLNCFINRKTYELTVKRVFTVVSDTSDSFNPITEVKQKDSGGLNIGDDFIVEVSLDNKRNNAIVAKQILMAEINNLKNNKVKKDVLNRSNPLVSVIVRKYDMKKQVYFVDFNNEHSGVIPFKNLISSSDKLKINEKYLALITEESLKGFNNQIILTRTGEQFVKAVFEKEIPEIQNEVIEIKDVYFNDNKKVFISVHSNDKKIDPVGTCIGSKGSRINTIINHFNGASIELFNWNSNEADYIINIFKDLAIQKISVLDNKILLFVSDEIYNSLNYHTKERLKAANHFIEEKVIITTELENNHYNHYYIKHFMDNLNLDEESAELLVNSGAFKKIDDLLLYSVKDTADILEVDLETAQFLIDEAQRNVEIRNLNLLNLDTNLKDVESMNNYYLSSLLDNGINNIVDLADLDNEELSELIHINKEEANKLIMDARNIIYG